MLSVIIDSRFDACNSIKYKHKAFPLHVNMMEALGYLRQLLNSSVTFFVISVTTLKEKLNI